MKLLFGLVCVFFLGAIEGTASAQQIGGTGQGNALQPGGSSLQQSPPGGLQGSTPAVFGGTNGGFLDRGPQTLKVANTTISASSSTDKPATTSKQSDNGIPPAVWVVLVIGAGLAFWRWGASRAFSS